MTDTDTKTITYFEKFGQRKRDLLTSRSWTSLVFSEATSSRGGQTVCSNMYKYKVLSVTNPNSTLNGRNRVVKSKTEMT